MTSNLKAYPVMKDSGAPWLGRVPAHWDVEPITRIGPLFKGRGGSKEDEVASGVPCVRYGDLYTRHEFFIRSTKACISEDRAVAYTPIRYGDVLFAASGETIEDIGRSAVNLLPSGGRCGGDVLVLRPTRVTNPRFLGYAADSPSSRHQKATMGRGFTVVHIYGSELKRLVLPLPPIVEQAAIVRFLDYMDRRIRRYIRAKQTMIKLLEEQKQTIINRAVTRGLDPSVSLKRSGVDWLGQVPDHWIVASLRFRYHQCLGKMVDAKQRTGKHLVPYLRNVDVQWDRINTVDLPQIDIAPEEHNRYTVKAGDLLVCEGRHLGRAAFWRGELAVCAFQKALHRLRPLKTASDVPRWLFYCLYVVHFLDAFGASSDDNSIPHLTGEMLRAHKFPFPPLEEQEAISAYLDEKVQVLEQARTAIHSEIQRAREYRTRLIADVVTGKLDVRGAAVRLPNEAEDFDARDEAETEADLEPADGLDAVVAEADA